jgi:hypothetical protein
MAHPLVLHRTQPAEGGIPQAEVARHEAAATFSDGDAVTTQTAPAGWSTDHCPLDEVRGAGADILDSGDVSLVPSPTERPNGQQPDHNRPARVRRIARGFLTLIVSSPDNSSSVDILRRL